MNPFGIQAFRSKRMPRAEKAMYAASALALTVLYFVL